MRGLLRLTAVLTSLTALSSHTADAVTACADCPSGKACVLETKDVIPTGVNAFTIKACNYDSTKAAQYKLEFALKTPLSCDPDGVLLPNSSSLTPVGDCSATTCTLTVNLPSPIDWAIAMKNNESANVLQAKFTGDRGDNTLVQVGTGTDITGALLNGGSGDSTKTATVCTTQFGVSATRLSTRAACNVVTMCAGKADDNGCPSPFALKPLIDNVACSGETCTGTLTFTDPLPCNASSGDANSLLASVMVGNSAGSRYNAIATLAAAPAAKISAVKGVSVGSKELYVSSDASCNSISVNVSTLSAFSIAPTNGSILVSLPSALSSSLGGQSLDVTVTQCGVTSPKFTVKVSTDGAAAEADEATDGSDDGSDGTVGSVTSAPGFKTTQKEAAPTGLSGGLYIGIGVGVLALFGFIFECVYHKRRHGKEFSNQGAGRQNHDTV